MNFAQRDRIFTHEVSYESPEKIKQDGTKFIHFILSQASKYRALKLISLQKFSKLSANIDLADKACA